VEFNESLPVLLALTASVLFAFGNQFQYIGLTGLDSPTGTMLSIASSAGFYWVLAPFMLDPAVLLLPGVLIFVLVGLFRPAVSANLGVASIRYLGPTLSSTLSATSPFFGTAFGIMVFGEVLTLPLAFGTLGVVGAIVLLTRRGSNQDAIAWPVWALGLPIAAAFLRGFGHALSKFGMESVPDPYVAGLVAFSVSAVITMAVNRRRKNRTRISWRVSAPYWFIAAGFTMAIAILCLNTALMRGQIISVVPISASSPIFTMLLSIFLFRRERLTWRVIAAVLIVVPSVVFIALNR
jgi:drug/metabolite transporter, DME family